MEGVYYMDNQRDYDLYRDIQTRCNGEIYIGVVGPVRTGKSTFIKRFMDLLVLPHIEDEFERERANDELPQSAGGKTITTTEPKFIPKEAASISLGEGAQARVRLIDCVGYMVEGAAAGNTSKETEIKLTNVAKASLQELLVDYEDFLRVRGDRKSVV